MHQVTHQQQPWAQSQHINSRTGHYIESELPGPTTVSSVPHYSQQQVPATSVQQEEDSPSFDWITSQVGSEFALQYFRIMKSAPENLPKFYGNDARISRIYVEYNGECTYKHASGIAQVAELLYKDHVGAPRVSVSVVRSICCQETASGGVFLHFDGKLNYTNDVCRTFSMSVMLLRQDNDMGCGYYVLNDIMTFDQPTVSLLQPASCTLRQEPPHETVVFSPQQNIAISQHQQLQQQLQQQIQQQPQLDQRQNVQEQQQHQILQQQQQLQQQFQQQFHQPQNQQQYQPQHQQQHQPQHQQQHQPQHQQQHQPQHQQQHQPQHQQQHQPQHQPQHQQQHQPQHQQQHQPQHQQQHQPQHQQQHQPQNLQQQRQSPQENEPQKSVQANIIQPVSFEASLCPSETTNSSSLSPLDDVLNVPSQEVIVAAETAKLVDKGEQLNQKDYDDKEKNSKNEETFSAATNKFSAWQTKPSYKSENVDVGVFDPHSKENYSTDTTKQVAAKNSYAAALLCSKKLPASCQKGYSIPAPEQSRADVPTQQQDSVQETKKFAKPASQQRSKTVWVSFLPQDMPDEKIKKAVAEQLKGQETEGHVVRVDRVVGQAHGYIELDTEMCAKILIKKGLHFQGRSVAVAFSTQGGQKFSRQRVSLNRKHTQSRGNAYKSDDFHYEDSKKPSQYTSSNANSRAAAAQKEQQQPLLLMQEGWLPANSRRKPKPKDGAAANGGTNNGFLSYKKNASFSKTGKTARFRNDSTAYTVPQPVN